MNRTYRILLLGNDCQDNMRMMFALVEACPQSHIESITNAPRLAAALMSQGADLVITDDDLAWTHGLEVLRLVKYHLPHCPVIMLTAGHELHVAAEGMQAGLDHCMTKTPEDMEHLIAMVRLALQRCQYIDALEQQVAQRTRELATKNHDLETFTYSVSHDLRAPLRAIYGFSEILSRRHRQRLNAEGQHYLENIIEASTHMTQLIDDLLRYARLGHRAVRQHVVQLGDVLTQALASLKTRISESGAHLSLPDALPAVYGDATLLKQIFVNLLDNALQYHQPEIPPCITVSVQTTNGQTLIQISDEGIGIAPAYHDKIFHMFQRLHTQDTYPGTGIGLAIVQKAVHLLGGRVWVTSAPGAGSTFSVQLPHEATR